MPAESHEMPSESRADASRTARADGLLCLTIAVMPLICTGVLGVRWARRLDPVRDTILGLRALDSALALISYCLLNLVVALEMARRFFRQSRRLVAQR